MVALSQKISNRKSFVATRLIASGLGIPSDNATAQLAYAQSLGKEALAPVHSVTLVATVPNKGYWRNVLCSADATSSGRNDNKLDALKAGRYEEGQVLRDLSATANGA